MDIRKKRFIEKVFRKFDITDSVFIMIQNDRELFQEWIEHFQESKTINSLIGKEVKRRFNLNNRNRGTKPKSTLIKSFQELE